MGKLRLLAVLVAALACGSDSGTTPQSDGTTRVLFIGNSLTYTNDLPRTFADVAALGGQTFEVDAVAKPNVALIDFFYDEGEALAKIANGNYDWVILQQGPTYPGLCADTLTLAAQMFADRVHPRGGKTAMLMTWPTTADIQYWDGVRDSYQHAATVSGSTFLPGGEAWRAAAQLDPTIDLYGSDGYHPAPLGTFLVALVIYERLTGKDARALPPRAIIDGAEFAAPEAHITTLQRAAHETNAIFPALQRAQSRFANITC